MWICMCFVLYGSWYSHSPDGYLIHWHITKHNKLFRFNNRGSLLSSSFYMYLTFECYIISLLASVLCYVCMTVSLLLRKKERTGVDYLHTWRNQSNFCGFCGRTRNIIFTRTLPNGWCYTLFLPFFSSSHQPRQYWFHSLTLNVIMDFKLILRLRRLRLISLRS